MTQIYLTMPQPGETISEGVIVKWFKQPGDSIVEAEAVCELETEKAVFNYDSPFAGSLVKILFDEGATVAVGTPIAIVDAPDDKAKQYFLLGIAREVGASQSSTQNKEPVQTVGNKTEAGSQINMSGQVKMSPYVRKRVRELEWDEKKLTTMANAAGRVTASAVDSENKEDQKSGSSGNKNYEASPCSAIRMRIAERMVYSKTHIPHAHTGLSVDMTGLLTHREKIKNSFIAKNGSKPSLLTLLLPALVQTIQKHPLVNASYWDEGRPHEIRTFKTINLGVAVGSPHGLVTPVIHECEKMDQIVFNQRLGEIVKQAEQRSLPPDAMTGMTFLFNNFGFFGTTIGVQVVAHPLSTTLGMGAIERRAVPIGDTIQIRSMADFVLAFDHRVMDGRDAGIFLTDLKTAIENP